MEVLQHEAVECELGNPPGKPGTALRSVLAFHTLEDAFRKYFQTSVKRF